MSRPTASREKEAVSGAASSVIVSTCFISNLVRVRVRVGVGVGVRLG